MKWTCASLKPGTTRRPCSSTTRVCGEIQALTAASPPTATIVSSLTAIAVAGGRPLPAHTRPPRKTRSADTSAAGRDDAEKSHQQRSSNRWDHFQAPWCGLRSLILRQAASATAHRGHHDALDPKSGDFALDFRSVQSHEQAVVTLDLQELSGPPGPLLILQSFPPALVHGRYKRSTANPSHQRSSTGATALDRLRLGARRTNVCLQQA